MQAGGSGCGAAALEVWEQDDFLVGDARASSKEDLIDLVTSAIREHLSLAATDEILPAEFESQYVLSRIDGAPATASSVRVGVYRCRTKGVLFATAERRVSCTILPFGSREPETVRIWAWDAEVGAALDGLSGTNNETFVDEVTERIMGHYRLSGDDMIRVELGDQYVFDNVAVSMASRDCLSLRVSVYRDSRWDKRYAVTERSGLYDLRPLDWIEPATVELWVEDDLFAA